MSKMTITEALAELKTINKRLQTKRQNTLQYVARDARVKDPLEREGGSVEFLRRERQAIRDLEKRVVDIRTAIQRSNLETRTGIGGGIGGHEMSVAEWLTWRREVSVSSREYLNLLQVNIKNMRDKLQKDGRAMIAASAEADAKPGDVVVHLEEKTLLEEQEIFDTVMGELDGRLSLLNATTTIEV
jgi:hypothetical protein